MCGPRSRILQRLRDATLTTDKGIEKALERSKQGFDENVASVDRNLKAEEKALLEVRGTPAEQALLGRRQKKLDWKTVEHYAVLANDVSTIILDVDGLIQIGCAQRPLRWTLCRRKVKA